MTSRSLRDARDPRRPKSRVAPLPPLQARRLRSDDTPTLVERPPVELSRPEEDDGLGLDRPLFTGNTDVVDTSEYDQLVSSSVGDELELELQFDQEPTPLSPVPFLIPPPPDPLAFPQGRPKSGDASVELVFGAPPSTPPEPTPVPPPMRTRVATPYAVGQATDRGLPSIEAPRRTSWRKLWAFLIAAGVLLLLGLSTLVAFLIARPSDPPPREEIVRRAAPAPGAARPVARPQSAPLAP